MFLSNLLLCPLAEQAFACSASQPPVASRLPPPLQGAGFRLQKPLNPSRLQRHPLPGAHGLRYASAGTSVASISFRNLAGTPVRRLMPPIFRFAPAGVSAIRFPSEISLPLQRGAWSRPGNHVSVNISAEWHPQNHIGIAIPLPVKFTWNGYPLYRYL